MKFISPVPVLDLRVNDDGNGNVLLSVVPPETGSSPSLDLCVVIDCSGSMGEAANPKGAEEIKLFSKMDLAKRGAEVIVNAMGPNDTLTILGFSNRVTKWLPKTIMDADGMHKALSALASLSPGGGTALWDALHAGLEELEVKTDRGVKSGISYHSVCLLLTDGQPSSSPMEGEVAALQRYLTAQSHARNACKLVTMGFGYDVNSQLLLDLANTHSNGWGNTFAFIPDGTMLLTNFVNLMANLKSTCAVRVVLRITPPTKLEPIHDMAEAMDNAFTMSSSVTNPLEGQTPDINISSLVTVAGEVVWKALPCQMGKGVAGSGIEVFLGDVLFGQERHVVLREQQALGGSWKSWGLDLSFETVASSSASLNTSAGPKLNVPLVTQQLHRALGVSAIHHAGRIAQIDPDGALKYIKDCALDTMALQKNPLLQGVQPHPILEDLLGQVSEAVSTKEAWNRWGSHYLRSLLCAHKTQTCNNFKDPGVLAYGSHHSRSCRDTLNSMCDSLPVPVPSIRAYGVAVGQPVSGTSWRHAFNNASGGCFGPGGQVQMADGSYKDVQSLRKGDEVFTPSGPPPTVVCVVKYFGGQTVCLPGSHLRITPWHPIRLNGVWRFPADIMCEALEAVDPSTASELLASSRESSSVVYNLVLDSGHIVVIDGVEAITLGHGLQEDVVRHPFFGTSAVIEQLKAEQGWEQGWIDLGSVIYRTSPLSGLVEGYTSQILVV